ncbi:MAG: hypothetical protein QOI05_1539 [Bradyrhizobium sp.]|jgi:site-specific DNA-methyltransferase (adenine-specific)|nr:hypothetical protein [Bradyrhizobium sp.]
MLEAPLAVNLDSSDGPADLNNRLKCNFAAQNAAGSCVLASVPANRLYFGDNLTVLRQRVQDESVDLIYLDPPFNSSAHYSVFFKDHGGKFSGAQAEAFRDSWEWLDPARDAYADVMAANGDVALVLSGLRKWLGETPLMAYLAMMTARLIELRRVLKDTGSLYLHCDPTASHYIKLILDSIFGQENFRNELIWKRQSAHSDAKTKFPAVTDTLLFYSKSRAMIFNPTYGAHDPDYLDKFYRHNDSDGRGLYRLGDMAAPKGGGMASINKATGKPNGWHIYKGFHPPKTGWRYSPETMARLDKEGRINFPKHADGSLDYSKRLALKRYLDEQKGNIITNIWSDIPPLTAVAAEALGYPTQKPMALMERILAASSSPGDVVLDPFCGCGTMVDAAEKHGRRWIGIDVTHYAITLIETRMRRWHPKANYKVEGRPTVLEEAFNLARRDKHQFQWWACWKVGAQVYREEKKGADRGIDGNVFYPNGPFGTGRIVMSVKGGENIGVKDVRDLRGVIEREDAEMGILITLFDPTTPMRTECAAAGFVEKSAHGRLPRMQVVSVAEIFDGKTPKLPPLPEPQYGTAQPARKRDRNQLELLMPVAGVKIPDLKDAFIDPRFDARLAFPVESKGA